MGKLPQLNIHEALIEVIKTREGRFLVDWLLKFSGVEQSVYHDDARRTDFLLGRQSVGVDLVNAMKIKSETHEDIYLAFINKLKEDKDNE